MRDVVSFSFLGSDILCIYELFCFFGGVLLFLLPMLTRLALTLRFMGRPFFETVVVADPNLLFCFFFPCFLWGIFCYVC